MSPWAWTRAPAALSTALVAVVVTGGPALAAPVPPIPTDVLEVFDGAALRQAEVGGAAVDADFSGARVAAVHEIHRFSTDFIDGKPSDEPVLPADQWLGALVRGDDVLGTLGVWRNDGGPAQVNGFANDVPIGRALLTLTPAEILVVDEPNGAYYAVDGTTVRPLNEWAEKVLPAPGRLAEFQPVVADQYAELRAQPAAEEIGAPPGLTIALVGMALALLVGGALLAGQRRRRTIDVA